MTFWALSALFILVCEFLRTKFHLRESGGESVKRWQANLGEDSCLLKGVFVAIHSSYLGRSYFIGGSFLSKRIETKVKESPGTKECFCSQLAVVLDSVFFQPLRNFLLTLKFLTELFCIG